MKIKIGIKQRSPNKYLVCFTIGVQTFYLQPVETITEAEWYKKMLIIAFDNYDLHR